MSGDSTPMPNSPPLEGPALREALKKQLEYYFSRENLEKDDYLKSKMNAEFYVPISTISAFKMVRSLTTDMDLIVEVLKASKEVVVHEGGEMVRPNIKTQRNTLILRDIPSETPTEEIEQIFSNEGCVKAKSVKPEVGNTWFVSFETEEDALKTLEALRGLQFKGNPIHARVKSENPFKNLILTSEPFFPSYVPYTYGNYYENYSEGQSSRSGGSKPRSSSGRSNSGRGRSSGRSNEHRGEQKDGQGNRGPREGGRDRRDRERETRDGEKERGEVGSKANQGGNQAGQPEELSGKEATPRNDQRDRDRRSNQRRGHDKAHQKSDDDSGRGRSKNYNGAPKGSRSSRSEGNQSGSGAPSQSSVSSNVPSSASKAKPPPAPAPAPPSPDSFPPLPGATSKSPELSLSLNYSAVANAGVEKSVIEKIPRRSDSNHSEKKNSSDNLLQEEKKMEVAETPSPPTQGNESQAVTVGQVEESTPKPEERETSPPKKGSPISYAQVLRTKAAEPKEQTEKPSEAPPKEESPAASSEGKPQRGSKPPHKQSSNRSGNQRASGESHSGRGRGRQTQGGKAEKVAAKEGENGEIASPAQSSDAGSAGPEEEGTD